VKQTKCDSRKGGGGRGGGGGPPGGRGVSSSPEGQVRGRVVGPLRFAYHIALAVVSHRKLCRTNREGRGEGKMPNRALSRLLDDPAAIGQKDDD